MSETDNKATAESGLQLLARLSSRPPLLHLDDMLFPEGPSPGDVIQISGESAVGKTMLLLKFLTKCLLPDKYERLEIGGLSAGVVLIDTDHNLSILKLVSLMEEFINSVKNCNPEYKKMKADVVEKIIKDSLANLIILKTYSSEQLEMNFYSLKRLLSNKKNVSLLVIDSLTAYYWNDSLNLKGIKKMDLYLKVMVQKLKKYIQEYKIVTIYVKQDYFQSKQEFKTDEYVNCKINLKKVNTSDEETFYAVVHPSNSSYRDECGHGKQYVEMLQYVKKDYPDTVFNSKLGRQGAFEIKINDSPVYSKLQTLAFPDYENVKQVIGDVHSGLPPKSITKLQPITDCAIM